MIDSDLDRAIENGAVWLEDDNERYSRYWMNPGEEADGESSWFCMECGGLAEDETEPCVHCSWENAIS
jgi:rubrerythrin